MSEYQYYEFQAIDRPLSERERLNGTLAGALVPLSQIPGSLETTPTLKIPKLPASQ